MLGFALHTVGETIIKSFVLSVTQNRHHCAPHSCQHLSVFRESDFPKHCEKVLLEEATHLEYNFHHALSPSSTHLMTAAGVQNYRTLLKRHTQH